MNRADWNLLILSAANGKRLTPVQFQKALFLLGKACPDVARQGFYDFRPYNFGAFDPDVYTDAERMEFQGLTQIIRSPGGWKEFAATPKGIQKAKEMEQNVRPEIAKYIRDVVSWASGLSFQDLVKAVYEAYPETRVNSIFKG